MIITTAVGNFLRAKIPPPFPTDQNELTEPRVSYKWRVMENTRRRAGSCVTKAGYITG